MNSCIDRHWHRRPTRWAQTKWLTGIITVVFVCLFVCCCFGWVSCFGWLWMYDAVTNAVVLLRSCLWIADICCCFFYHALTVIFAGEIESIRWKKLLTRGFVTSVCLPPNTTDVIATCAFSWHVTWVNVPVVQLKQIMACCQTKNTAVRVINRVKFL